jgi:hypothetical protein
MRFAPIAIALAFLAAPLRAEVRWQLDAQLQQVSSVTVRGVEGPGNYAYMVVTVSNRTGREVPMSFGAWASTDVPGRAYRGTIDPIVKAAVERKSGKTYKTLTEVRGEKLPDGESVELLVSFGKIDPSVDFMDVHLQGLVDRVYRDKGKTWIEDKVLVLEAARPGDEFERQYDLIRVKRAKWVALEPAKELKRS